MNININGDYPLKIKSGLGGIILSFSFYKNTTLTATAIGRRAKVVVQPDSMPY